MSDSTAASLQRGVIVEFDFAVLPGHKLMLDICRTRLAQDSIKLDEQLMARIMNGKSFSSALNVLSKIVNKTIETSDVTSECYPLFEEALKNEAPKIPAGFAAFVKALHAKGLKVVIVTKLRRKESFTLSWVHPEGEPAGRSTIWLHQAIPLRFVFDDADAAPPLSCSMLPPVCSAHQVASGPGSALSKVIMPMLSAMGRR